MVSTEARWWNILELKISLISMMNTRRLKITKEITQYSLINLQLTEMIRQFVSYIQRRTQWHNDNSY